MLKRLMALATAPALVLALSACEVRQTEEGEMPDIDVNANGGALPEYDVDAADVDVDMEPREIEVPDIDVDVDSERRTLEVPDVDVTMPSEEEEVEVPNPQR